MCHIRTLAKVSRKSLEKGEYPKVLKYWGTKNINFPFVPNGKLMTFRFLNI